LAKQNNSKNEKKDNNEILQSKFYELPKLLCYYDFLEENRLKNSQIKTKIRGG